LHKHTSGTASESHRKRKPNETFFAAQSNFHALSIGHNCENGSQAVVHKEGMLDWDPNLLEQSANWQGNKLQFCEDYGSLFLRKSEQDFIMDMSPVCVMGGKLVSFLRS
jgi:hypothetical protein